MNLIMVSNRCHNVLFSCCCSLLVQSTALTFMSASVNLSFFTQLRNRHGTLLRFRLSFLSFFKRALLPSSTRQSKVRSWLWDFCSSKTLSASHVRICAVGLNFVIQEVVYAVLNSSVLLFFLWRFDPIKVQGSLLGGFAITLIGDTTHGMTPLGEWSARRRDLYLTTHNTHHK